MIYRTVRWLRKLAKNNQKGFTLIEMLVVISILGILAAVVTMSMIGVTNLAQSRANDTEQKTVQVALDTMANEQQLSSTSVCPNSALITDDMSQFPQPQPSSSAAGNALPLYPRYLRSPQHTHRQYSCGSDGVVIPH